MLHLMSAHFDRLYEVLVEWTLRASVIMAAGSCLAYGLRHAPAAATALAWKLCLAASLMFPFLSLWTSATGSPAVATGNPWHIGIVCLWLSGVATLVFSTAYRWIAAQFILRSSKAVVDRDILTARDAAAATLRIDRVALGYSQAAKQPLLLGARRPTLILPSQALDLAPPELETLLIGYLARVASRERLSAILARAICCGLWFQPLAWYAARSLREAAASAADDVTLSLGVAPFAHAELVYRVESSSDRRSAIWPLNRLRSGLERRLLAVLDARRRRGPLPATLAAGLVGASCLITAIALVPHASLVRTPAAEARPHIGPLAGRATPTLLTKPEQLQGPEISQVGQTAGETARGGAGRQRSEVLPFIEIVARGSLAHRERIVQSNASRDLFPSAVARDPFGLGVDPHAHGERPALKDHRSAARDLIQAMRAL